MKTVVSVVVWHLDDELVALFVVLFSMATMVAFCRLCFCVKFLVAPKSGGVFGWQSPGGSHFATGMGSSRRTEIQGIGCKTRQKQC